MTNHHFFYLIAVIRIGRLSCHDIICFEYRLAYQTHQHCAHQLVKFQSHLCRQNPYIVRHLFLISHRYLQNTKGTFRSKESTMMSPITFATSRVSDTARCQFIVLIFSDIFFFYSFKALFLRFECWDSESKNKFKEEVAK